jgi:hypothetical protein
VEPLQKDSNWKRCQTIWNPKCASASVWSVIHNIYRRGKKIKQNVWSKKHFVCKNTFWNIKQACKCTAWRGKQNFPRRSPLFQYTISPYKHAVISTAFFVPIFTTHKFSTAVRTNSLYQISPKSEINVERTKRKSFTPLY